TWPTTTGAAKPASFSRRPTANPTSTSALPTPTTRASKASAYRAPRPRAITGPSGGTMAERRLTRAEFEAELLQHRSYMTQIAGQYARRYPEAGNADDFYQQAQLGML